MTYTIVLSGPAYRRTQAGAALRQAGIEIEPNNEDSHGFTPGDGESFITAHYGDVDAAVRAVEGLDWVLRSHWATTGGWQRVSAVAVADPLDELQKLRAQLRAAGINLGDQ